MSRLEELRAMVEALPKEDACSRWMREHWHVVHKFIVEYSMHTADAVLHESVSRKDISMSSALACLNKIRDELKTAFPQSTHDTKKLVQELERAAMACVLSFGYSVAEEQLAEARTKLLEVTVPRHEQTDAACWRYVREQVLNGAKFELSEGEYIAMSVRGNDPTQLILSAIQHKAMDGGKP